MILLCILFKTVATGAWDSVKQCTKPTEIIKFTFTINHNVPKYNSKLSWNNVTFCEHFL